MIKKIFNINSSENKSNIKNTKEVVISKFLNPYDLIYKKELPINQKKNVILELIKKNQVIIILGDTGSGKTTQIPKFCLEIGRGIKGIIGHTQPRRLSTCSVAERISVELKCKLGENIGYKIRFKEKINSVTQVKLMTDGILLAELQKDKMLSKYDTIIIDEAHERTLNIDFILGYLRQLLTKRCDLKLIITSATIELEQFSNYFPKAPLIEVSGRTYPIEVRYRPNKYKTNNNYYKVNCIVDAIKELSSDGNGDILIFMCGEYEIFLVYNVLLKLKLFNTKIIPLFASLSNEEQNIVFDVSSSRKIILSTNIAETSITIPSVKYVIDTGYARIKRYNYRKKINQLQIEQISQASANQRKGRCGRLSDGICIRLYSEENFFSRPKFTDPEYLRSNLSSVILQMISIGFNNVNSLPFIDLPDKRNIRDGIKILEELNAIKLDTKNTSKYILTDIGRQITKFSIDPKLGRIIVEAKKYNVLNEIIIIVSALSIKDPKEYPLNKQKISNEKHNRFCDKKSDFISYLNLWNYLINKQKLLSNIQFKKMCNQEFLNYLVICEWQDLYKKLKKIVENQGIVIKIYDFNYYNIHISLLSGFLFNVGKKDIFEFKFIGIRNTKFFISSNSVLFKKKVKWIMAYEIIKTSKLYCRIAAFIKPEWIELLADHLIKKKYSNPYWSKLKGKVIVLEKLIFYGLNILSRLVNYNKINSVLCREIFIHNVFIDNVSNISYDFIKKNLKLINEIKEIENKIRCKNILIDEKTIFSFFDQRIPKDIFSLKEFNYWWELISKKQPNLLHFEKKMFLKDNINEISEINYPSYWKQDKFNFVLSYSFNPGSYFDGITVFIPLMILNQIKNMGFEWLVPGFRYELIVSLIKTLPKFVRCKFIPISKYVSDFLKKTFSLEENIFDRLEYEFYKMSGVMIKKEYWKLDKLPMHLKMTFCIVDHNNQVILKGKNLNLLKESLRENIKEILSEIVKNNFIKTDFYEWNFKEIPQYYEFKYGKYLIKLYPALFDKKNSVSIRLFETKYEQEKSMLKGIRRLILLNNNTIIKLLNRNLLKKYKMILCFNCYNSISELIDDCILCSIDYLIKKFGYLIWNKEDFEKIRKYINLELDNVVIEIINLVKEIFDVLFLINKQIKKCSNFSMSLSLADLKKQLSNLIFNEFISLYGWIKLHDILRYLYGIKIRLEKILINSNNDLIKMNKILYIQNLWQELVNKNVVSKKILFDIEHIRWMIEELRINIFAQHIGTPYKVSEKKIKEIIEKTNLNILNEFRFS
ncbi:ATP-dependent RNA helicase HrpA [Candidatus Providencia siddallii]|uniref:ATP-dependent RNA helicase HrpA n=1 Tax=Candidatus Providencia siddallii TaxID=1715285 RepID=A0ABM9NPT0_9GAMM